MKKKVELHLFADESKDTMCAVAYLTFQEKEYSADLAFLIEKCRVAPMRQLSIPCVELKAAVLAVRFNKSDCKGKR